MTVYKYCLRAELGSGPKWHCRMHSELACSIRSRGHHATLVALTTNDNRLALQRRVEELFDRYEEGVHVDVKDDALHSAIVVHEQAAGRFPLSLWARRPRLCGNLRATEQSGPEYLRPRNRFLM